MPSNTLHPHTNAVGPRVFSVVVFYNPSDADVATAVTAAERIGPVVAVANMVSEAQRERLARAASLTLIDNRANLGLARALNQGLEAAMAQGADYVLLLDQDSRPDLEMLPALVAAARCRERDGQRIGCIAPRLRDRKLPNVQVGAKADRVETVATSGSLITRGAWETVGPMREDLFIDGIDHEWCFRARSRGFETVIAEEIILNHDMGTGAVNFFGRFKPIQTSPVRHYFITRNTLWLARCDYIPWGWRLKELAKTVYRAPFYLMASRNRLKSLRNLLHGVVDGLFVTKMGPVY